MARVELDPNTVSNYRFGRQFDQNRWFRAYVAKATLERPERGKMAGKLSLRCALHVDAEYTSKDTGEVVESKVKIEHRIFFLKGDDRKDMAPDTVTTMLGKRADFLAALGYGPQDRSGKSFDTDELYGCEFLVQIGTREYDGKEYADIKDLRAIAKDQPTRREGLQAIAKEEYEDVPF